MANFHTCKCRWFFFLYYYFSDLQITDFWLFEMHFILFICSTLETRKCDAKRLVLFCFLTRKDVADRQKTLSVFMGRKPQTYIRGGQGGTGCRQPQHSPLDAVKSMATVK